MFNIVDLLTPVARVAPGQSVESVESVEPVAPVARVDLVDAEELVMSTEEFKVADIDSCDNDLLVSTEEDPYCQTNENGESNTYEEFDAEDVHRQHFCDEDDEDEPETWDDEDSLTHITDIHQVYEENLGSEADVESEGVFKLKNERGVEDVSIDYDVIDNLMLEKVSKEVPLLLAKLHRDMRGTSDASTPEELRDVTLSDVMRYWLLDFLRDMKSHCQFVALRLHKSSPRWGTLSDVFKTILALMVAKGGYLLRETLHRYQF